MPTPLTTNTLYYGDNLAGTKIDMPPAHGTFKEARRVQEEGEQMELGM